MEENILFHPRPGPSIDLNEQLVPNKPATFFLRVNSNAMSGAGIHPGDLVIVDRSLQACNGQVVIAVMGGEMLIRRLELVEGRCRLLAATPALADINLPEGAYYIWGVVTYVIHQMA